MWGTATSLLLPKLIAGISLPLGMLNAVDEKLAAINEFPYNVMPSSKLLAEYEERMKKVLTGLGFGRIVFCKWPSSITFKDSVNLLINFQLICFLHLLFLFALSVCSAAAPGHNDANQKNLIWSPQERSLSFIDFEMTMNNYQAFDLGYLFGCYPGHFLVRSWWS